jgi:type IV secretory pathway VirB10-like protein
VLNLGITIMGFALLTFLTVLGINQRRRWHTIVGVAAILLFAVQTYTNNRDTANLGSKIDELRTLLSTPPKTVAPEQAKKEPPAAPPPPVHPKPRPTPPTSPSESTVPTPSPSAQPSPPAVGHVRFTTAPEVSTSDAAPYALRVVLQTDVTIQNPAFAVRCECDLVDGRLSGLPVMMNVRWGVSTDRHAFLFSFSFPSFSPETPLSMILQSKTPIRILGVERL